MKEKVKYLNAYLKTTDYMYTDFFSRKMGYHLSLLKMFISLFNN